jgi:hypothetical protein
MHVTLNQYLLLFLNLMMVCETAMYDVTHVARCQFQKKTKKPQPLWHVKLANAKMTPRFHTGYTYHNSVFNKWFMWRRRGGTWIPIMAQQGNNDGLGNERAAAVLGNNLAFRAAVGSNKRSNPGRGGIKKKPLSNLQIRACMKNGMEITAPICTKAFTNWDAGKLIRHSLFGKEGWVVTVAPRFANDPDHRAREPPSGALVYILKKLGYMEDPMSSNFKVTMEMYEEKSANAELIFVIVLHHRHNVSLEFLLELTNAGCITLLKEFGSFVSIENWMYPTELGRLDNDARAAAGLPSIEEEAAEAQALFEPELEVIDDLLAPEQGAQGFAGHGGFQHGAHDVLHNAYGIGAQQAHDTQTSQAAEAAHAAQVAQAAEAAHAAQVAQAAHASHAAHAAQAAQAAQVAQASHAAQAAAHAAQLAHAVQSGPGQSQAQGSPQGYASVVNQGSMPGSSTMTQQSNESLQASIQAMYASAREQALTSPASVPTTPQSAPTQAGRRGKPQTRAVNAKAQ